MDRLANTITDYYIRKNIIGKVAKKNGKYTLTDLS